MDSTTAPIAPPRLRPARLGEELPVFCEKCGYSLHGATAIHCAQCQVLHFRCPECGHTQPINTLRPAFQRMLGRLRAAWLVGVALFKLAFFGLLLFAWGAGGNEGAYIYNRALMLSSVRPITVPGPAGSAAKPAMALPRFVPRDFDIEAVIAFAILGLCFGLTSRMLLLRWKRGYLVGLVLGTLVSLAIIAGGLLRMLEVRAEVRPFTDAFLLLTGAAGACTLTGCAIAWGLWMMTVKLLLPARIASPLLEWQTSLSDRAADLAR